MALELSPLLLAPLDHDEASIDDAQSKYTLELRAIKNFLRKRFWWLCLLGIAAIITLRLSFLPRTSPSRDFRRWHGLHFTRSDVKRVFLVQLEIGVPGLDGKTVEQNLNIWLTQLSAAKKSKFAVASKPAARSELTLFVESLMRALGFSTSAHTYSILENLRSPISLELHLVDSTSSRVLYSAKLQEPGSSTPAYYLFGKNGTVRANYVYCNSGSPKDFQLLKKRNILLREKIAVFSHSLHSEFSLEDKIKLAEKAGCLATVVFGEKDIGPAISRNYKPVSIPDQKFRLPVGFNDIHPILHTFSPASPDFPNWSFSPNGTDNSLELMLTSEFSKETLTATNIIASIDGSLKDSEIVIGASRDVLTSSNPLSGHAIMLETMRRLGHLQSMGWKPLRSIRFVSWDASRSGGLGSLEAIRDNAVFDKKMPILAYINLDDDVITGSHFSVDSNPLFNHILKTTADSIPFPKSLPYYKRLLKDSVGVRENDDETETELESNSSLVGLENDTFLDDDDDDYNDTAVSLLRYWFRQDRAYINNKLGQAFAGKDSATFQIQSDTPVISLGFQPSPNYNDTLYIPESESYSMKWATDELDPNLTLHALLVRFLGLLVLSLSEHEVVDSRTQQYFLAVQQYYQEVKDVNKKLVDSWSNATVSFDILKDAEIYYDIKERKSDFEVPVSFLDVLKQMDSLVKKVVDQARVFDKYNQEVENLWRTDYPWYLMIRKIHIYAKFKVSNYKLLRLEKELGHTVNGLNDLNDTEDGSFPHHFMYDIPQGIISDCERKRRGAFAALYEAFKDHSMEQVVRVIAAKYERLKEVYKRIT